MLTEEMLQDSIVRLAQEYKTLEIEFIESDGEDHAMEISKIMALIICRISTRSIQLKELLNSEVKI